MLSIRLLGPIRLESDDGKQVWLSRRKEEALLAFLATEHSDAHSRDSLMGLLWPDFPADKARLNLRVNLSNLKKRLKPLGADALFHAVDLEIQFRADACVVDVVNFVRLLRSGDGHSHRADELCAQCAPDFTRAVDLYRGPFVDGLFVDDCLAYEEWLFMQRERFRLLHLHALEKLAAYHQHQDELDAALIFARRQLEVDPLREPTHMQIMQMLLAQGNRAAALRQYEQCRAVLEEELGLSPSLEIEELVQQIQATAAPRTPVAVSVVHAPPQSSRVQLPSYLTPFIGRQDELDLLDERIGAGTYRLLSLVGAGGMGKTRLAVEAAHRQVDHFADGVYFAPLASVQQGDDAASAVTDALAATLDITFRADDRSTQQQLLDWLRPRRLLLVIDNFEHLLDATPLLLSILHAAPQVTLLVTSREPLRSQAEDLIRLIGLPVPENDDPATAGQVASVRLFVDRAYRMDKGFRLHAENAADVALICRLLEGRPLGIELAAAHTAIRPCHAIADAIRADLDFLAVDLVDVPARHRSLRAVFEQSWRALTPTEQSCFARLSIFRNPFSVEAAVAVAGASLPVLTRLYHAHLIERLDDGERFGVHELLRQFAADKLTASLPNPSSLQRRHAEYILSWLSRQENILSGIQPRQAADLIQRVLDDVRAAWDWASAAQAIELSARALPVMAAFHNQRGMHLEGERVYLAALDRAPESAVKLRAQLLVYLGAVREVVGKYDMAHVAVDAGIILAEECSDYQTLGLGYLTKARAADFTGATSTTIQILQRGLNVLPAHEFLSIRADLLMNLGSYSDDIGDGETAMQAFAEARAILAQTGNKVQQQRLLLYLSFIESRENYPAALATLEQALALGADTGNRALEMRIYQMLGFVLALLGDFDRAIRMHLASLQLCTADQDSMQQTFALHNLCLCYDQTGDYEQAYRYGMQGLALAERDRLTGGIGFVQLHLGHVMANLHLYDHAAQTLHAARKNFVALENAGLAVEAAAYMARVAYLQGDLPAALVLVEDVVAGLNDLTLYGMDEPMRVYLYSYQVLAAAKDSRAQDLLDAACAYLQLRADRLDPEDRERFLSAVPANRAILAAWGRGA